MRSVSNAVLFALHFWKWIVSSYDKKKVIEDEVQMSTYWTSSKGIKRSLYSKTGLPIMYDVLIFS